MLIIVGFTQIGSSNFRNYQLEEAAIFVTISCLRKIGTMRGKKKLREVIPFLQTFKDLRPNQRSILIGHIDDKSCEILYEAIANVLRSPRISDGQRKKLRKILQAHKSCLRSLISNKTSRTLKRKKLQQIGGFPLATILATAVPLVLDLLMKK